MYRYTFIDRDQGQRALNYWETVCMVRGFDKIHLICQRNQSMFCYTCQCFIFKQPFTSNVDFMIRWLHINFNHTFHPKCWRKTRHSGPTSHWAVNIFFPGPHLFLFWLLPKKKENVNSIGLYKIPLIKVLQYLLMTWKKGLINTFSVRVNCWKYMYAWLIIYKMMSTAHCESTNTWSMVIFPTRGMVIFPLGYMN